MCTFLIILAMLMNRTDGRFSEWNMWSRCSVSCGKGLQARERIAKFEKCYSELSERRECNERPCIELTINLALNSSVTPSSLFLESFPASNIVDGNVNTDFYGGSCMQTNKDNNPYVRIHLNATVSVHEVVIFNRGDCCSSRLNNVMVYVGNNSEPHAWKMCGHQSVMDQVNVTRIKCCEPIAGDFVHVRVPGPQFLSLCEVQVYGIVNGLENLAIGKSVNQSSTYSSSYEAAYAVDGDLDTNSYTNTYIAWLRVDIGGPAIIYWVRLYPTSSSFEWVENTNITIGNNVNVAEMTSCGVITVEGRTKQRQGEYAYDVTCGKPLVGRYIQVNKNSDNGHVLAMSEFEVYGRYM